jgi:hypothetical protein
MNYIGFIYYGRSVHSTNNYSKYFTVTVNNTRSRNMSVAILNDISDFPNHRIIHIKMNISTGDLHCKKPTSLCARNTAVCNFW